MRSPARMVQITIIKEITCVNLIASRAVKEIIFIVVCFSVSYITMKENALAPMFIDKVCMYDVHLLSVIKIRVEIKRCFIFIMSFNKLCIDLTSDTFIPINNGTPSFGKLYSSNPSTRDKI